MRHNFIILLIFFFFISNLISGQTSQSVSRQVELSSSNQILFSYKILNDSCKGFFSIEETISGKTKLISDKCTYPFKFENNILKISGHKLILGEQLNFTFKTFEQDVKIDGTIKIENYPYTQLFEQFEKVEYKLKAEEPIVVVKDKPIPLIVNKTELTDTNFSGIKFRVQIAAATSKMDKEKLKQLTNLSLNVHEDLIDNYFKYTIGNESSISVAQVLLNKMAVSNFKKPFIVAYKDGKRITVQQAMAEINAKN